MITSIKTERTFNNFQHPFIHDLKEERNKRRNTFGKERIECTLLEYIQHLTQDQNNELFLFENRTEVKDVCYYLYIQYCTEDPYQYNRLRKINLYQRGINKTDCIFVC